jgi:NitT/TauT family transport system substrate-binding protein
MRVIGKLGYSLAAAIPVLTLAACSASATGTSTGARSGPLPEVSTIVIDTVPTPGAAGIYIAQDDGYFARQGLTVKIVPVNGGEYGMGDLQTGKAQLVEGNDVSFILAQAAGTFAAPSPANPAKPGPAKPIDMRIVADSAQMQPGTQALYVRAGSPYKTVGDLVKGHAKVGVNSLHNIGSVLLGSLLAADGYPADGLTQVPEVLPKMPALLAQGKISAAWLPEPLGTQAQQQFGAVAVADFDQGPMQNFPIGALAGDAAWIKSHPHTIAAFLRAYNQGQQIADTNRAAVEQTLVKNGVAPSTGVAATMTLDSYPLSIDVPVLQRVPDAMYEFGVLGKRFDIASMIDPEPGEVK